jgi:hypothetical protein
MNFKSTYGSNMLAAAIEASKIQEEDDSEISIVDLTTPPKLTNELSPSESLLNRGFDMSWAPGTFDENLFDTTNVVDVEENQRQEPQEEEEEIPPSLEAHLVSLERRANKEDDKKKKKIQVLENCVVQEALKRPASPILSGNCARTSQANCSQANGPKLRRLLEAPPCSTAEVAAATAAPKKRISLSLKKKQTKKSVVWVAQPQQPEPQPLQQQHQQEPQPVQQQQDPQQHKPQSQNEWLDDFGSQREIMSNVFSLWRSLKKENLDYQKEAKRLIKSASSLQAEIAQEEELVRAAQIRLAEKMEQLKSIEKQQGDIQRQQDICKRKMQHFNLFK